MYISIYEALYYYETYNKENMSSYISINVDVIEKLLSKNSAKNVWMRILATHIKFSGKRFHYILNEKEFLNIKFLDNDIINNLSIGEISALYEYTVASKDPIERKNSGQYFTPDDISKIMASYSKKFKKGIWLDPCSGIGNLSWYLVDSQKNKEEFIIKSLILSDKDELALLIAKVIFTLSFQKNIKDFYNQIAGSFINLDFLSVSIKTNNKNSLGGLELIPKHDYVIVNPPYLGLKKKDNKFLTAESKDLYAYFLENIIHTSKGFISITPQSYTNANRFFGLRDLLLKKYNSIKIFNFDNVPANIFFGVKHGSSNSNKSNSIRASIMIASNNDNSKKISTLLRWRSTERQVLLDNLERYLTEITLTSEYFPKVSPLFANLYNESKKLETLQMIISESKTDYFLYIPSTPRYFIPALMEPVNRASMKKIYFTSEKYKNYAYILLNSSYTYWWWRVRDGGMTLSLETLYTLPMPKFKVNKSIINKLKHSEKSNKVYKLNAGKIQENVKHEKKILNQINKIVAPSDHQNLILLHDNSEISQLKYL